MKWENMLPVTQLKVSAQELSVLDLLWNSSKIQLSLELICHTPTLLKRLGDQDTG